MTKDKKQEVAKLLQVVANGIGKRLTDKDGNLDVKAFNEQSCIKQICEKLRSLGVKNSEHLTKLGFVAAGMVLRIK